MVEWGAYHPALITHPDVPDVLELKCAARVEIPQIQPREPMVHCDAVEQRVHIRDEHDVVVLVGRVPPEDIAPDLRRQFWIGGRFHG